MENPAQNFTTGIPMSRKGNGDHSDHGCKRGEFVKDDLLTKLHNYASENDAIALISDSSPENGVCFNPTIQDGDHSELFYNIVLGTELQDGENESIPSLQVGNNTSKYDESDSIFHDHITSLPSVDVVVQDMDEPIEGLSLNAPEFKLLKGEDDEQRSIASTIEEQQKKLNESISAIAKSFGLEDLIPETFQADSNKDLFSVPASSDTLMGKDSRTAISLDNFAKEPIELHIPDSPIQLAVDSDLYPYSQSTVSPYKKRCEEFDNGLLMRVPVIMKDGTTRYVLCSRDEIGADVMPMSSSSGKSVLKNSYYKAAQNIEVEHDSAAVAQGGEDVDIGDSSEGIQVDATVDITSEEHNVCDLLMEALDVGKSTKEYVSPATISITTDNVNKKMQIILTTAQGQQVIEIDTDQLGLEPIASQIADESGNAPGNFVRINKVFSIDGSKRRFGDSDLGPLDDDDEDEIECEKDLMDFVRKFTSIRGTKQKLFLCPIEGCGQVVDKECKLRVHMISHRGARPFKCDMDGCDWAFSTLYRLRRHIKTHVGMKDFLCDFEGCSRRFTTIYNLNTHKKRHIWPTSLTCPSVGCGMTFANRRRLELHLRVHSDIEAPYKCAICGKKYYSANCIASHYRTHQYSEDDFKCPFKDCRKKYDKICRLKQHLRHHTGERPYSCPAEGCEWSFMSASKLTRHMRKHTGERKFVCTEPGCGKSFMRPEHLKGHVVIHSGDKPFQCPHENCNAKFTAKSSLYVHVKKHSASGLNIVYHCPVSRCSKKYNNKATLKQHIQKSHPDVLKDKKIALPEKVELTMPVSISVTSSSESAPSEINDIFTNTVVKTGTATKISMPLIRTISASRTNCKRLSNSTLKPKDNDNSRKLKLMIPSPVIDSSESTRFTALNQTNETEIASLKLFQENSSGSARTDYCCSRLSGNTKKLRLIQNRVRLGLLNSEEEGKSDTSSLLATVPIVNGVLLQTQDALFGNSMVFQDSTAEQLGQLTFLHDVPPTVGIYQDDDGILANNSAFSSELPLSASLFLENSDSNGSAIAHTTDSTTFLTAGTVDDFAVSTSTLNCLE